jgi:hypothetical protein
MESQSMEILLAYLIIGALAAHALYLTFRGRNSGVVVDPTIGFFTVGEPGFAALLEEDRAAFGSLFSKNRIRIRVSDSKMRRFVHVCHRSLRQLHRSRRRRPDLPACGGASGRGHRGACFGQRFGKHRRRCEAARRLCGIFERAHR